MEKNGIVDEKVVGDAEDDLTLSPESCLLRALFVPQSPVTPEVRDERRL